MFTRQALVVTESESAEWHSQFGDTVPTGLVREMSATQAEEIILAIVERQIAEYPDAESIDSGILLSTLGDNGFDGALEMRLESLADDYLVEEKGRRATVFQP